MEIGTVETSVRGLLDLVGVLCKINLETRACDVRSSPILFKMERAVLLFRNQGEKRTTFVSTLTGPCFFYFIPGKEASSSLR